MKRSYFFLITLSILGWATACTSAQAATLAELTQEAIGHNSEIAEAAKSLEAASAQKGKARSPYFPEFGVEGGGETYKSSNSNLSNGYGFAFGRLNLFRGGRDRYGFQIQSREEEFAGVRLGQTKARISREIASRYYELVYFREAIRIKEEALALNQAEVQMAAKRKRAGITSDADVLEFELRDATLRSDLLLLNEDQMAVSRELARLLGRGESTELIAVEGTLGHDHFNRPLEELFKAAVAQREDLNEAKKTYDVASIAHSATLSEWLPKVDAEATYGTLPRRDRILTETPAWGALVKVTIPLFSGLDSYYDRQTKAREMERSDLGLTRLGQEVRVQVQNAYARIKAVEARVDLEEKNIERAKRYYDVTLAEYKRGVKNSPDLAGAAERLFDSKLRNLQFRRDFYLARTGVAQAIGASGFEAP